MQMIRFSWLIAGIIFALISIYLSSFVVSAFNPDWQNQPLATSNYLFFGAVIHLFVSFILSGPSWNSWHVPRDSEEHRDPFIGMARPFEFMLPSSEHGVNEKRTRSNRAQGFSFAIPGLVMLLASIIIGYIGA